MQIIVRIGVIKETKVSTYGISKQSSLIYSEWEQYNQAAQALIHLGFEVSTMLRGNVLVTFELSKS